MASVDSTLLWLAEQITDTGLIPSYEVNSEYPSYGLTPMSDVASTMSYTRIKDQALTILALLPKYSVQSKNPSSGMYEYYYQKKIDSLVTTLLTLTEDDFGTPEFFPEYINTASKLTLFEDTKSINTTAWVVYALCEYYSHRVSLAEQIETLVTLDSVKQKLQLFAIDGLLSARNLAHGPTLYLFSASKQSNGVLSSDVYYILDSIICVLALLKCSSTLSGLVSEELQNALLEAAASTYKAILTCVNSETGSPHYSISSTGIFDSTTKSSELTIFYGLLLYSFGESSKVSNVLNYMTNFEFPKSQLGFAEFIYKFKEIAIGYKPFLEPPIEMSDPKISYMASLLLKKLGNLYEADELINNLSAYVKTENIDGMDYSYSIFTLDPSKSLISPDVIKPWKSIEATCWSVLGSRYKELFVDGYVNSPWSLSAIKTFLDLNLIDSTTGLLLDTELKLFKKLVDTTYLVVAKYIFPGDTRFNPVLLVSGRDYKFDFAKEKFYINSYSIKEAFKFLMPSDDFLKYVQFELLFLSRTPDEDTIESIYSDLTRDGHISKRSHSKFNRIIYKKEDASNKLIRQSVTKETFLEVDPLSQQIKETPEKARLFRKDLEESFPPTRTTLHRQPLAVQINSPDEINPLLRYKNQIDYDLFNPLERDFWKIRVLKNTVYQGVEQVTSGIWTNYFGVAVPRNSTEVSIMYSSVDTSPEAQIYSRDSLRWKDFLGNMSFSSIYEFLACRRNSPARNLVWTRGSASRLPRPYKSSRRATGQEGDPVQAFRRDETLFNRTENLSDYEVSSSLPDLDSNYAYETKKGSVINRSLFNTTTNILEELTCLPNSLNFVYKDNITVNKTTAGVTSPVSKTSVFKTLVTSYKNIYYPVLSKEHKRIFEQENSGLVGTFSRYEDEFNSDFKGALDFTDRSQYYVKIVDGGVKKVTTSLKKSPYAGNLNLRACFKSGDLFQDIFDKFIISAGDGVIRYHDVYTIDTFEVKLYPFKHQSPIIVWFNNNTGETINYGYSPVQFSSTATPNVKVRLNGIELEFSSQWTITSDPVPSIFLVQDKFNTYTDSEDVLTIEYDALGEILQQQPATNLNRLQKYVQKETMPENFFSVSGLQSEFVLGRTNIVTFTFEKTPKIHWFRDTRGDFVNSGNNPNYYYDDVTPNISVKYNGISLKYLADWHLDYNSKILRIAINNNIGCKINPTDIFIIEYEILDLLTTESVIVSGSSSNLIMIGSTSAGIHPFMGASAPTIVVTSTATGTHPEVISGSSSNQVIVSSASTGTQDLGEPTLSAMYYRII